MLQLDFGLNFFNISSNMHTKAYNDCKTVDITDITAIKKDSSQFGFLWLDSTLQIGDKGQKSFLFTDPLADIYFLNGIIHTQFFREKLLYTNSQNIYDVVEELVQKYDLIAVGYISYESSLNTFNIRNAEKEILPSVRFLMYENFKSLDSSDLHNFQSDKMNFERKTILKDSISKEAYIKKVTEIKNHIKEGDIYQANFTTRFKVSSPLSPIESYLRLRELNPSPYASYLNFGNYQILSSSPERMFKKDQDSITSCPIKGTIALGNNIQEQETNLSTLLNSQKDKAELLMIVDLMRNDLGRIAQTGSINVDSIYKPEIYSSLIHLVSDISGKLKPHTTFSDIIEALIPGGSITGAPKKRAIEIINKMESYHRFIYTGSIGYLTKEKADFNIAIRTMYHYDAHYYIHAGGGIVADSNPEDEYNEMLLKAKNLFHAVGLQHD